VTLSILAFFVQKKNSNCLLMGSEDVARYEEETQQSSR